MATRRTGGRPPRGRERHAYVVRLELPLFDLVDRAAEQAGTPRGVFTSVLVGSVYGYQSPWEPELDLGALGLDLAYARRAVGMPPKPLPVHTGAGSRDLYVRLDRELADRFNAHCDAAQLLYAAELRRIIAAAWGMDGAALQRYVQQHGHQAELPIARAS